MPADPNTLGPAHYPRKRTEHEGLIQIATSCVQRLLELGLPEHQAFTARDAVMASITSFDQRKRCGEWEPR